MRSLESARVRGAAFSLACLIAFGIAEDAVAQSSPGNAKFQREQAAANANTVTIMAAGRSGTYIKLVEDLQNVLDDTRGNELRILPVIGRGGAQNMRDVLMLKGVDMGLTESGYFAYFKNRDPELYNNINRVIHYIAKLYNAEFHVMARKDIRSIEQLRGKKVNFWKPLSATDIGSQTVFRILGVDVEPVYLDQELATFKLKNGEIAAMARMAGSPLPAFTGITPEDDLHFVPLTDPQNPNPNYQKLLAVYLPATLKSEAYPAVIPEGQSVQTVATSVVLATYAWPKGTERYRRVARFVTRFFDNFEKLRQEPRNPKWRSINLAAEVPGWTRFAAAEEWLATNSNAPASELKTAFNRFLSTFQQSTGVRNISNQQREQLFEEFVRWYNTQR
ncbi:MAG: TAXI family TRAP transporter solute-binding subunit [Kiloniellales bacterium]|nr:TAXI family TRAP transporter solute-binding subunit [Kiloniellales bacterium]